MLPRLPIFFGLACLALLPVLGGCSSSQRKDQNYGTNAGADYQIPDAATFSSQSHVDANEDETLPENPDADAATSSSQSHVDTDADETLPENPDGNGSQDSGSDIDS